MYKIRLPSHKDYYVTQSVISARSTEALSITGTDRSQPTAIVTPDKRSNDGYKSLPRHSSEGLCLPRKMHPMRSFSIPTPPPLGQKPGAPVPKHIGRYCLVVQVLDKLFVVFVFILFNLHLDTHSFIVCSTLLVAFSLCFSFSSNFCSS